MLPSERDAAYLWDMLEAAQNVANMVAGKTFVDYENDLVLRSAIERQVENFPTSPSGFARNLRICRNRRDRQL